jgi:hypothetical protein
MWELVSGIFTEVVNNLIHYDPNPLTSSSRRAILVTVCNVRLDSKKSKITLVGNLEPEHDILRL